MIKLNFVIGSAIRRVFIKDRVITLLTVENSFVPIEIDLNNLDNNKSKVEKSLKDNNFNWGDLSNLKSEKEIAEDIIIDFKKSGWRLVSIKHGE